MENSKIEWTDHTFNPWIGCTKVSPGCARCYAETLDRNRFSKTLGAASKEKPIPHWGKGAPRHKTATWKEPLKWNNQVNRRCRDCGFLWVGGDGYCPGCEKNECDWIQRPKVFCASMSDWLDDEVPVEWLADLLKLIYDTPHLDWLLLTKRPENWRPRLLQVFAGSFRILDEPFECWLQGWLGYSPPENVWIGTTVENQECADKRIPELLGIPAKIRFLSCEPLLGPLELEDYLDPIDGGYVGRSFIDWIICGGESGPDSRAMHPDWARSLRDQCQEAGVPFFFKQWGEWSPHTPSAYNINNVALFNEAENGHVPIYLKDLEEERKDNWDEHQPGDVRMYRAGKAAAGRLLDGREWSEFPGVAV
jgi:protein gp37